MRKLTCFLSFFLITSFAAAQTFPKAPKDSKPIKQIVEWTTFAVDGTDPEETIKDGVYAFRKDGQLQQWVTNNSYDEVYNYEYDGKNRLTKVTITNGERTRTMTYQYYEDRRMAEIQERDADVRNIQYFNKVGQIVEEKSFLKGELSGGKWATMERTVFNYTAKGLLFGEMRYEPAGPGKENKYKTVHEYNDRLAKTSTTYFEADGKPCKILSFQYDEKGQLVKEETKMPKTGEVVIMDNSYKNGKIWQSITKGKNFRNEKVYKDGRLIRSKEYDKDGKLIYHTDFQYVFY